MKKLLILFALLAFTAPALAQVNVQGYYRQNGTYVQPHQRTSPDGNPYNNYSYQRPSVQPVYVPPRPAYTAPSSYSNPYSRRNSWETPTY